MGESALAARERKKQKLQNLEAQIEQLREQNSKLKMLAENLLRRFKPEVDPEAEINSCLGSADQPTHRKKAKCSSSNTQKTTTQAVNLPKDQELNSTFFKTQELGKKTTPETIKVDQFQAEAIK